MTTYLDALSGWFKRRAANQRSETSDPTADTDMASGTTTGGDSSGEPVVVWEAANRMEAEIVAGRLQSQDIPAVIRGEALGPIYGLTTGSLAAALVLVPAPLADKAVEILATDVDWNSDSDLGETTGDHPA